MLAFDYANAGEVERTGLEPPDRYRETLSFHQKSEVRPCRSLSGLCGTYWARTSR